MRQVELMVLEIEIGRARRQGGVLPQTPDDADQEAK